MALQLSNVFWLRSFCAYFYSRIWMRVWYTKKKQSLCNGTQHTQANVYCLYIKKLIKFILKKACSSNDLVISTEFKSTNPVYSLFFPLPRMRFSLSTNHFQYPPVYALAVLSVSVHGGLCFFHSKKARLEATTARSPPHKTNKHDKKKNTETASGRNSNGGWMDTGPSAESGDGVPV